MTWEQVFQMRMDAARERKFRLSGMTLRAFILHTINDNEEFPWHISLAPNGTQARLECDGQVAYVSLPAWMREREAA